MRKVVVLLAVVAMAGGLAYAQETTGDVRGFVSSEDGARLPGVTITVESLETGLTRTAITQADGSYLFAALPPGKYAMTASLDGFQTYKRNVLVDVGRTNTNDFTMKLGAVTDVIEVTGEAPLVDVTSTVAGLNVNSDELNARVPVGRESTQIALLAPGTVQSDTSFNSDSSYTPGQNVVSIGGASIAENLYAVNGLNVTNFRNMVGSSFIPMEFVQEVQVKTGGYEAEYGRSMGGVINMVTKSGTNSLRGSASVYLEPEDLQEQSPDAWNRSNVAEYRKSLEGNASIGGAFVQDKLFFFGFVRYDDTEYSSIVGARETVFKNDAPYYGAKLDWNITPSHRVEGTYIVDDTDFEGDRYEFDDATDTRGTYIGTGINERGGDNYILKYTGILTENFLISGQYGLNEFGRTDKSSADDKPYSFDCRGSCTPIGQWVNWQFVTGDDEREAYRLDADWYLGNHSLRGGVDFENLTSAEEGAYSGGIRYVYLTNEGDYDQIPDGSDIVEVRTRMTGGEFETEQNAVYVQDSWAVTSSLTVNLGVRWEQYENFNAVGDSFIKIDDQYAPRLGAIWDPTGNGRSKVYASFGQYHMPIANNTNIRLAGLEFDLFEYYEVTGQGGGLPYNPDGTPTGLGQLLEETLVSDGSVHPTQTVVASEFDPMSQLEYIIGYEQMVGDNWSFGGRFIHREYDAVIEDFTIDQGLTNVYGLPIGQFAYVLGNPGEDFSGFYDIDGDGTPDPISFSAEELGYPEASRDYYAVELTFNRRFADNWTLQGSYTWSHVYGNYEGYVKSDLGQDDAGLTQDFDFAGLMDHAYGNLPNDRRHNFKMFGAYAWDMGLQVGGYFNFTSGRPINAFAVHPTDPFAELYGNDSFFFQETSGEDGRVPAPRGSFGETDDIWALDTMVKYDFAFGPVDANVRVDIFNITDEAATTEVSETSGTVSLQKDDSFLQPLYYQQPRTIRLGFGLTF